MNFVEAFVASPLAMSLGWTLLHFVWQGVAVTIGAAVSLYWMRRQAPEARYAAGLGALLLLALCPVCTFAFAAASAPQGSNADSTGEHLRGVEILDDVAPVQAGLAGSGAALRATRPGLAVSPWLGWAAFFWLAGVIAMSLRLLGGWFCAQRLRRVLNHPAAVEWQECAAYWREKLRIRVPVTVLESHLAEVPLVIGWLRPVLLLPVDAVKRLRLEQIEPLILHELAHVCRNDYLVNLVQTLLETLLFFHPGVWWVSSRVRLERECCCDAMTVQLSGDRDAYAEALVALESLRVHATPAFAMAALGPGMLLRRIQRMYTSPEPETGRRPWSPVLALTAVALVLLTLGAYEDINPVQAESADPPISADNAPGPVAEAVPDDSVSMDHPAGTLLLPVDVVGSSAALGEIAKQLDVLLATRLSSTQGVRLVERAQLDPAMAELKLGQSGLMDGDTAAQIGRLTGAGAIVQLRVMTLDEQRIVSARVVQTETGEFKQVEIPAPEDSPLSEHAGEVSQRLASLISTAPAESSEPGDAAIAAVREALKGQRLPRIAVSLPETHLGTVVPDPAGETEMIRTLSQLGFPVVDVDTLDWKVEPSTWSVLFLDQESEQLTRLRKYTDLMIVGEAFSEFVGEVHGFQSCQARLEAQVIDVNSGHVAGADSQHANAADLGEFIAGKKALRDAGRQTALALAPVLAEYWSTNLIPAPR